MIWDNITYFQGNNCMDFELKFPSHLTNMANDKG